MEKSSLEQRRLCSNPGRLFVCFGGGCGKMRGTCESEGIGSSPGWSSLLVQERQMHMPLGWGWGTGGRALLVKGGCLERKEKETSASSLVGPNSIWESKEKTVIKHCFLHFTMVCREPSTGPPPPAVGKRLRQVKFQHGKYDVDVTRQTTLITCHVCSVQNGK